MAYKEMRNTRLPSQRARSVAQFQSIRNSLSELKGTFWSASTMSEMGKKLLKEMDRVLIQASESDHQRSKVMSIQHGVGVRDFQQPSIRAQAEDLSTNNDDMGLSIQDFGPSTFNSGMDIDLFDMFDPAFDLDGFDACLEGTLNPGFRIG